jgi:hypothetical protein
VVHPAKLHFLMERAVLQVKQILLGIAQLTHYL